MKRTADHFVIVSGFILFTVLAQADADPLQDPMPGKAHGEMGKYLFKSMDTNGDGVVSKAEFKAYSAKRFKKMDANKDGKLTPDEVPGAQAQGLGPGSGTRHLDERFNAADTNKDGGIDREEAKAMPMLLKYFEEVDTNKDGKVTRQEYLDAMPRLHGVKPAAPAVPTQSM